MAMGGRAQARRSRVVASSSTVAVSACSLAPWYRFTFHTSACFLGSYLALPARPAHHLGLVGLVGLSGLVALFKGILMEGACSWRLDGGFIKVSDRGERTPGQCAAHAGMHRSGWTRRSAARLSPSAARRGCALPCAGSQTRTQQGLQEGGAHSRGCRRRGEAGRARAEAGVDVGARGVVRHRHGDQLDRVRVGFTGRGQGGPGARRGWCGRRRARCCPAPAR